MLRSVTRNAQRTVGQVHRLEFHTLPKDQYEESNERIVQSVDFLPSVTSAITGMNQGPATLTVLPKQRLQSTLKLTTDYAKHVRSATGVSSSTGSTSRFCKPQSITRQVRNSSSKAHPSQSGAGPRQDELQRIVSDTRRDSSSSQEATPDTGHAMNKPQITKTKKNLRPRRLRVATDRGWRSPEDGLVRRSRRMEWSPDRSALSPELSTEMAQILEMHFALKTAIELENFPNVLQTFPRLLERGELKHYEASNVVRLAYKSKTPYTDSLKDLISSYMLGRIDPYCELSANILLYLRDYVSIRKAMEFFEWIKLQRNEYGNLRVYAFGMSLFLAEHRGLFACKELFEEALEKYGDQMSRYHLMPNAACSNPHKPTATRGTGMVLLNQLAQVYLYHGEWQNAYLCTDTVFRLHPEMAFTTSLNITQTRPLNEAFQYGCMGLRAGASTRTDLFSRTLRQISRAQLSDLGQDTMLDLSRATLAGIHHLAASSRGVGGGSLCFLAHAAINLLPPRTNEMGAEQRAEVDEIAHRLLIQVLNIHRAFQIPPHLYLSKILISAGKRRQNKYLFNFGFDLIRDGDILNDMIWKKILDTDGIGCPVSTAELEMTLADWLTNLQQNPPQYLRMARSFAKALNVGSELETLFNGSGYCAGVADDLLLRTFRQQKSNSLENAEPPVLAEHVQVEASMKRCSDFLAAMSDFELLVRSGKHRDLYNHPPERITLLPASSEPPEAWQRELYAEMCVPSATAMPAASNDSADTQPTGGKATRGAGAEEAERSLEPNALHAATDASGAPVVHRTHTGYPLAELRFRSWADMNNLLLEAAAYEQEVQARVAAGRWSPKSPPLESKEPMPEKDYHPKEMISLQQDLDVYVQQWTNGDAYPKDKEEWKQLVRKLRRVGQPAGLPV